MFQAIFYMKNGCQFKHRLSNARSLREANKMVSKLYQDNPEWIPLGAAPVSCCILKTENIEAVEINLVQ